MKVFSPARSLLAIALLLGGCAAYTDAERAQLRQNGVAPATLFKLERGEPLAPGDLLELHRRDVRDTLAVRHLDKEGVDSLYTREDFAVLRRRGVSPSVRGAAAAASDRFAREYGRNDFVAGDDPYLEAPGFYGTPVSYTHLTLPTKRIV